MKQENSVHEIISFVNFYHCCFIFMNIIQKNCISHEKHIIVYYVLLIIIFSV